MNATYQAMKKEAQTISKRIAKLQIEHDNLVRGFEAQIVKQNRNKSSK